MKSKLLILLLLFCFRLSGQVPNSETFTFQNVITELSGVGTQARVDRVTRNSTSGNTYISCNGYAEDIIWDTDATTTMSAFVAAHSGDFGAVTVFDNYNGSCDFIADVPGVDFTSAFIPVTYGTAENIVPNISESSDLINGFERANSDDFDSRYYLYYLVAGDHYLATNSLLNFRNYNGSPDGIPIPINTGAHRVTRTTTFITWECSAGATGFRFDVALDAGFTNILPGYTNIYISKDTWELSGGGYKLEYLVENLTHYYRVRAVTGNGTSASSNGSKFKTATIWYLPALEALQAMYDNLWNIETPVGDFSADYYWSSTEYTLSYAYSVSFGTGSTSYILKSAEDHVRATRHFTSEYNYDIGEEIWDEDEMEVIGIVFYKYDNGDNSYVYYICTPTDQSELQDWSNVTDSFIGGTSTAITAGYVNTALIIGQFGHTYSAAQLCVDVDLGE